MIFRMVKELKPGLMGLDLMVNILMDRSMVKAAMFGEMEPHTMDSGSRAT